MKDIGVEVRIEGVRRIKMEKEEWGKMMVVKLGNKEEKKRIMEGKKKLRGGKGLDNEGFNLDREENKMEDKRDSKRRRGKRK